MNKKQADRLVERIEQVVPYVLATIAPGNHASIEGKPDWVAVHKGRSFSSYQQLELLLGEARLSKMKLTKRQLEELRLLGKAQQPASGHGRAKVQRNLIKKGLASLNGDGLLCSITNKGRQFLRGTE